ncbi:MAG TPA: SET domain-containing protein [Rhizomicrobium sp.]|nr:SET domain-containing protein [Rhizomicrobium sp.]
MRDYLARSWINPKLVGGESKIHGEGVFASAPVARGEKLMEFGGARITAADLESGDYRECSVWLAGDGIYLALPISDPDPSLDENLNHSCDPNAWLVDEVTLVARLDIAAGEEITLDHGTWNFDDGEYTWDDADCGCGARDCRKRLTENDWKLPAVRERYRGHFHPHVQRMIDALDG